MASNERTTFLHYLRGLNAPDPLPDRELLRRFTSGGDEAAFEAVMRRHGPLVLGIGRRLLGNAHDAEEVYQATFLLLARKAGSLPWRESVAGWLCEVARRLALEARGEVLRRRGREAQVPCRTGADPLADVSLREAEALVEEELGRLPRRCRAPLLLCCLEGKSRDEAAADLGLSLGTLKRRLEQGRRLLRVRLRRRGLTLPGALLALELCREPAGAVPASLLSAALNRVAVALVLTAVLLAGVAWLPASREAIPSSVAPGREPAAAVAAADLPPGAVFRLGAAGLRHGGSICGSTLSPDGRLLATASGRSVAVWDVATRKRLLLLPCDRWPHTVTPQLAFSADGKRLGYVHSGSFACVWDLAAGKELRRFEEKGVNYISCAFTRNGKQFALSARPDRESGRLSFWDLETGKVVRSLGVENVSRLSPDAQTCVRWVEGKIILADDGVADWNEDGTAFSLDGKKIALVEHHKAVQVRDTATGKRLATFGLPDSTRYKVEGGHDYWRYHVSFSADGRTLLLGTPAAVHRWDLDSGNELPRLGKHLSKYLNPDAAAAHAPAGGRRVFTTGPDGLIRVWDTATGREAAEPESYVAQTVAACSPREALAAVGDTAGRIDLWDMGKGKRLRTLVRQGPAVRRLAFSPDGKTLAGARADGKVSFWDLGSGREGKPLVPDGQDLAWVPTMTFSPDGRTLCLIARYQMRLYDTRTGKVRWGGRSACADFSPDGATLAASDGLFAVRGRRQSGFGLLDAATGMARLTVPLQGSPGIGHNGVWTVCFAPEGGPLAAALPGGEVCLCDPRTGEERKRFRAVLPPRHIDFDPELGRREELARYANGLAYSGDGRLLATCGNDGAVRVWEVSTGEKVLERNGHEGEATGVAVSPDGRSVLSAGDDGQVFVWALRPASSGPKPTLEALWKALGSDKAKDAYRAVLRMSEAPGAAAFLRKKVPPVEPVDEKRLAKLLAELGSDRFATREAATAELEKLGERAAHALRRVLAAKPEPEVQRRLRRLLARLKKGRSPEDLHRARAVQALELAGTLEARRTLKVWAGGAPVARLTTQARQALQRLERRPRSSP